MRSNDSLTNYVHERFWNGLGQRISVITNPSMADHVPREVPRTWMRRLFGRPWRPWKKRDMVIDVIPWQKVAFVGESTIVCHPKLAMAIEKQLEEYQRQIALDCSRRR